MQKPFESIAYVANVGKELVANFQTGGFATTPGLKGSAREVSVREKLEHLLPRSPIEKSLFGAASYQGCEEAAPHSGLGLAVSSGAGTGYRGFQRLQPVVWGRGGGGQTSRQVETPRNPAVRGQVAARMRVRLATVAV